MVRNVVGFAGVAVFAVVALRLLGWLLGFAISIFGMLLWLAFWGFVIYLIMRVLSPSTADRMRDTIRGNKPAE